MGRYTFPLSVQIALPEDFLHSDVAHKEMSLIAERGLTGVEVNFADPDKLDPDKLGGFLAGFNLRLTYFASGLTAKTFGLSLSSTEEEVRTSSSRMVEKIIGKMAESGAGVGIIIGFFKGGPGPDPEPRRQAFRKSLEEIVPIAERAGVSICVEATNRYESCIANSLADTRRLLDGFPPTVVEILPDTFHMNIEESNMEAALADNLDIYRSVHLSDNNRFLPGYGAIDFERILRHLKRIGYAGGMALEGNVHDTFLTDLVETTELLEAIGQRIES
jgi:5-keto-L-gluconate epimerase